MTAVDTALEKPAVTSYAIDPLLRERWSPRAFSPEPLAAEQVLSLFEAARWSPSAMNEQPWGFIVAPREDAALFAQAVECLAEGNRVWAQHAPLLVVAVARLVRQRDGAPNGVALYDLGQSVAHLTVQAASLGWLVHQMGGFSADVARAAFGIPDDHAPVTFIAIGRMGDPGALPETLRERELAARQRKPLSELVFGERWGHPSALLSPPAPDGQPGLAGAWQIDPAHSTVAFSAKHLGISTVRGTFAQFSGTIVADEQDLAGARVDVQIDAASISTGDAKRDAHLRSADFLDADQYSALLFAGTRLERLGASRARLHGELTIRDVTRPVVLEVEYTGSATNPWGIASAGFRARTTISRKQWGIVWNVALEAGGWLVSDEIAITIEAELVRPAAG